MNVEQGESFDALHPIAVLMGRGAKDKRWQVWDRNRVGAVRLVGSRALWEDALEALELRTRRPTYFKSPLMLARSPKTGNFMEEKRHGVVVYTTEDEHEACPSCANYIDREGFRDNPQRIAHYRVMDEYEDAVTCDFCGDEIGGQPYEDE